MKVKDILLQNVKELVDIAYRLFAENRVNEAMVYMKYANKISKEIEEME